MISSYCLKKSRKHIPLVVILSLLLLGVLYTPLGGASLTTDVHATGETIVVKYDGSDPCPSGGNVYARWKVISTTADMGDAEDRWLHCVQPSSFANTTKTQYTIDQDYQDDATGKYAKLRKLMYYSYGFGAFTATRPLMPMTLASMAKKSLK